MLSRTRQAGITVHADIDSTLISGLDTVHRHAVLRVVQEGLTNVLKHARPAATASVAIRRDAGGQVLIEVCDDGGYPAEARAATDPGHGLIVMRERVELLDGAFEAAPRGPGWALRAVLPAAPTGAPTAEKVPR